MTSIFLQTIALCFVQAIFNISGVALIRSAAMQGLDKSSIVGFVKSLWNLHLLGGLFLIVIGFLFTILILMSNKLSVYQPISSGLTFIVTIIVSVFFLKESINLTSYIGILFIMVGCIIIGLQQQA